MTDDRKITFEHFKNALHLDKVSKRLSKHISLQPGSSKMRMKCKCLHAIKCLKIMNEIMHSW